LTNVRLTWLLLFVLLLLATSLAAQGSRLRLDRSGSLEVVVENGQYVTYVVDDVIFRTENSTIYCDSAIWRKGRDVSLKGNVRIVDSTHQIEADSVYYDITSKSAEAWGDRVEMWSYTDSIYAVGPHVIYRSLTKYFFMDERPLVYLRYPDSLRMVEIISDSLEYLSDSSKAQAWGDVKIFTEDLETSSGMALMDIETSDLVLTESPSAIRGNSEVLGSLIRVDFEDELLQSIVVIDSAEGLFREPTDSTELFYDESILRGENLEFQFKNGKLDHILCYGQAYSWYFPSAKGGSDYNENSVSGDTIRFLVENEELRSVRVRGGAIGTYITGKYIQADSLQLTELDSIDYQGQFLDYKVDDSVIFLESAAGVNSEDMALTAHNISFDVRRRVIEAFSAVLDSLPDSAGVPEEEDLGPSVGDLQPNAIPVVLQDGDDVLLGDYLEYSIDTRKGRIVRSKTDYNAGYYYGGKLFREQEKVFYIKGGHFTTCDREEPHFHFYSSNLKMIADDKLVAQPMIFYVGRIPVFAFPFFVQQLKRGRRSGFTTFTLGDFQSGSRGISGLGYFWAPSEYFDWKNTIDYYENTGEFKFNTHMRFAKRYYITNTYFQGSYSQDNNYDRSIARETNRDRWEVRGAYNHAISPSLNITASGHFVSDESFSKDFSNVLSERLNRNLTTNVQVQKKFANNISVTGKLYHQENLDLESRTDQLPTINVSLPSIKPFGEGKKDASGQLQSRWYHEFTLRYSPYIENYSNRTTIKTPFVDSVLTGDSVLVDTTENIWEPLYDVSTDTLKTRTRKEYSKISHSPTLTFPGIRWGDYVTITPQFKYQETWVRIYDTDQSRAANITADDYRMYVWNTSVTASTKMYGIVQPNVLGLAGFAHIITPKIGYAYRPELDRHPAVRAYAGGVGYTSRSSAMTFAFDQLFEAKTSSGELEQKFQLLSLKSNWNYDFEKDSARWSDVSTSYSSNAIPGVRISGRMVHTPYDPITGELDFLTMHRNSFSFTADFTLRGKFRLFEETEEIPRGAQDAANVPRPSTGSSSTWSVKFQYNYGETNIRDNYRKTDSTFRASVALNFSLTPTTRVSYSQTYDFVRAKTLNASIRLERKIHCWTGSLFWVPIGSNRGFGFRLAVTELPDIEIKKNAGRGTGPSVSDLFGQ